MMTGLSALAFIGGLFTIDSDVLDMNQDRSVHFMSYLVQID